MRILICGAIGAEMKIIKSVIKNLDIKGLSAQFLITGIGNHETHFSLAKYLLTCPEKPDLILNIGLCGWFGKKENIVQIARIVYAGTMKETIVPLPKVIFPLMTCFSSDNIVIEDLLHEKEYVADMESFAVDFVCQKFQIPRIILKIPYDNIGKTTKDFDYKKALEHFQAILSTPHIFDFLATFS